MGSKFANNHNPGLMKYSGILAEAHGEQLRRRGEPNSLCFKSTDELPDLQSVIGQPRAFRALELGSEVAGPGYNIFILGMPGSGRTTLRFEYLQRWVSVENGLNF